MSTIKELLFSSLRKNSYYCKYESSGREIASRCPYCGGSNSDKTKRQFYIKVDKPPYLFHCFRCGVSGTIAKLVMDLPDIFLPVIKNVGLELLKYEEDDSEDNTVTIPQNNELCSDCQSYLESRLSGRMIEAIKDSVVCCKSLSSTDSNLSNFIGFKTVDDSTIVCRNKDKTSTFRYKNLKLSESKEFNYFVATVLDNHTSDYICVVGEGIFTTLSAADVIREMNTDVNIICISSLSKSRLYYTSKYVVPQLPYKFKETYVVVDKDDDYELQIQKMSKLQNDDSRYRIIIPTTSKDMNEQDEHFEIKI